MEFTYVIEGYYSYESRIFVTYTPKDETLEPLGAWVHVDADMTQDQIKAAAIDAAPLTKWAAAKSANVVALIGTASEGAKYEPEPLPDLPKTQDQLRELAKIARAQAVNSITVTTSAGNTFDGDETSQTRMARAIIALQATGTPTTTWVLHDNSAIQASAAELSEALALAGAAQGALWVLP